MANQFCGYCGGEINRYRKTKRQDAYFHDETCRSRYHAEKRRAKRAIERAKNAIAELSDIRGGNASENRVFASQLLEQIYDEIQENFGSKWKCAKCGDEITSKKQPLIPCRKCKRKGFINIAPKII